MLFQICTLTLLASSSFVQACLPGCRCDNFDLESLKCNKVGFTKFPMNIENDVEFLHLKGNEIQELPSNLSKIAPQLVKLEMPNNKVKKLEDRTFAGLGKLDYLSLQKNELTEIGADNFEGNKVTGLAMINLSENKISKIASTAFKGFTTAELSLRLEGNSIANLHKDVFAGVRYMHTIDLSRNQLEQIDANLFRNQRRTYQIRLYGNKLTTLHVDTFKNVASLQNINLGGNDIEYLPNDIFRNNPVLEEIDLRENQLTRLPVDLYLPKEVHKIKIFGNPLICDCVLKGQTIDAKYIAKFEDFYDVVCNNYRNRTVREYLENLNCETTTTPTTTLQQVNGTTDGYVTPNMTAGENKQTVITVIKTTTTRYEVVDRRAGRDTSDWPIVLGVLLGGLVLIVCVALILYLNRKKIRDKIIDGRLALAKKKKKLTSTDSTEDFQYHDAAGWTGASTAMLKQTEGNV